MPWIRYKETALSDVMFSERAEPIATEIWRQMITRSAGSDLGTKRQEPECSQGVGAKQQEE